MACSFTKGGQAETAGAHLGLTESIALIEDQKIGVTIARNSLFERWWAGLDSNQRTLA